jgi:DNA-binding protein
MARVIDITDKLNFEEKPRIKIKGEEIEINDAAVDMLKIMPQLSKRKLKVDDINLMYQTLFPEESQKKIESLRLNFEDFSTVVLEAAAALQGGDGEGETQTPATI